MSFRAYKNIDSRASARRATDSGPNGPSAMKRILSFALLVIIPGIVAGKATIDKSAGINLSLWIGGLMLVIGAFFVIWILLKPPPPVTTAEMEAARKAREEFGTQAPPTH